MEKGRVLFGKKSCFGLNNKVKKIKK